MGRLRGAASTSSSNPSKGVSKGAAGGGAGYGDADVAKLKEAIQTLCQSTHPLGESTTMQRASAGGVNRGFRISCMHL